jgi:hypothetical protein
MVRRLLGVWREKVPVSCAVLSGVTSWLGFNSETTQWWLNKNIQQCHGSDLSVRQPSDTKDNDLLKYNNGQYLIWNNSMATVRLCPKAQHTFLRHLQICLLVNARVRRSQGYQIKSCKKDGRCTRCPVFPLSADSKASDNLGQQTAHNNHYSVIDKNGKASCPQLGLTGRKLNTAFA